MSTRSRSMKRWYHGRPRQSSGWRCCRLPFWITTIEILSLSMIINSWRKVVSYCYVQVCLVQSWATCPSWLWEAMRISTVWSCQLWSTLKMRGYEPVLQAHLKRHHTLRRQCKYFQTCTSSGSSPIGLSQLHPDNPIKLVLGGSGVLNSKATYLKYIYQGWVRLLQFLMEFNDNFRAHVNGVLCMVLSG